MTDGNGNSEQTQSHRGRVSGSEATPAQLLQGAAILAIAADADEIAPPTPSPRTRQSRRIVRSPRRRRPVRLSHHIARRTPEPPAEAPPADTQSELRNWIKDNATLLSNASLLISLAAVALGFLPPVGFIDPYLKALIFGAAIILLIELHHQWPDELQIHMIRSAAVPDNHSWRMAAFAFFIQAATLLFAVWAALSNPIILIPLTAFGTVFLFRRWYFRKPRGVLSRWAGIVSLVAVVLLTEILMLVVWAVVTRHEFTIELWHEQRPSFDLDLGSPK